MSNTFISVIMSVHNNEKLLESSIESILNQSHKNFEFIITDDFSTDKTSKILEHYKRLDKRISIIRNSSNLGLTKSLNNMLHISKGEYIARQDGDDISFTERLEYQLIFVKDNNFKVCSAASINMQTSKKIHYISSFLPKRFVMKFKNPYVHGTLFIERKTFFDIGLYNENFIYSQDYELMSRLISKKIKIGYLRKPLYNLNMKNNISVNFSEKQKYYADCVKNNLIPQKIV